MRLAVKSDLYGWRLQSKVKDDSCLTPPKNPQDSFQNTGELAEYKYGEPDVDTQGPVSPESLVRSGFLKDPEIGLRETKNMGLGVSGLSLVSSALDAGPQFGMLIDIHWETILSTTTTRWALSVYQME